MQAMKAMSVTTTESQERAHRISHSLDLSTVSDATSASLKVGPMVSVFLAEPTRMGCELMATGLQRHRYKLMLACCATDSIGMGTWFDENDADAAIINADLREGATAAFDLTREIRGSHPQTSVIMMIDSIERVMIVEAFRGGATGISVNTKRFAHAGSYKPCCQ
jgi:hypothetical protein